MAEDRDDLIKHYRDSRATLLQAIDGLSDEQMSETTIDGWAVKDHLAHLALWDDLRAADVERVSAGHDSAWKMTDEQDDDFNEVGYQLRRTMSPAQARWELDHSRTRLLDAIAAAPPEALDPERYGAAGVRSSHEGQHAEWLERWRREKGY